MHSFSPSFAIVLDTVLKSTVLLALAWSAALVMKKRSAAAQHMVRTFSLVAVLLLPFFVILLPAWHIKGLPGFSRRTAATPHGTAAHSSVAPTRASIATPANSTFKSPSPALLATLPPTLSARRQTQLQIAAANKNAAAKSNSVGAASPAIAPAETSVAIPQLATVTADQAKPASSSLLATFFRYLPKLFLDLRMECIQLLFDGLLSL